LKYFLLRQKTLLYNHRRSHLIYTKRWETLWNVYYFHGPTIYKHDGSNIISKTDILFESGRVNNTISLNFI